MKRIFLGAIACIVIFQPERSCSCNGAELTSPPIRPQEPKRPFPYLEEEVRFSNPRAKVTLAGTLTRPKGHGPFPAVLLVTGSGPVQRDEIVAGHRVFLVLSHYLTRRGLAVLRFDKRGLAESTGDYKSATTADFAEDAIFGLEYLKRRKDIDPKRIGALGHSEGGTIMPTLAADWPDTAFVVLLAGVATTGGENLVQQLYLIDKAEGATEEELCKQETLCRQYCAICRRKKDVVEVERQLRPLLEAHHGKGAAEVEAGLEKLLSPWHRFAVNYSAVSTLQKVRCPLLALNGERDLQVPPKENLRAIAKAMVVAGNTDFVVREMPKLNHLFQTCKTGCPREYAEIEETMSPVVLRLIGDWVLDHVGHKP